MLLSTAFLARQNSISASGPCPCGCFSLSRCITVASRLLHSDMYCSRVMSSSESAAACSMLSMLMGTSGICAGEDKS